MIGIILAGVAGSTTLELPIYHLCFTLGGLFLVAFVTGWVMRPRLKLHGEPPDKMTAGRTARVEIELHNPSSLPCYDLSAGLFDPPESVEQVDRDEVIPALPPGERTACELKLRARRRGLYELPEVTSFTTYPFNLFRVRGSAERTGTLTVLPSFHPLVDLDVPVGRLYQPGGIMLTSDIGESLEYIGNREYRPGDSPRRIDFRSWARLAKPVVREYQEEYYCRLAVVLDTQIAAGRRQGPEGFPDLEAGVSLVASVADVLARGEYIIDIFAAGPELYYFRGGRHVGHLENILEILACVEESREDPFETIGPALVDELRSITAIIFVFLDWDRKREQFVRTAMEAGAGARVLIVRDGPTTRPYEPAQDWAGRIMQFTPDEVQNGAIDTI